MKAAVLIAITGILIGAALGTGVRAVIIYHQMPQASR